MAHVTGDDILLLASFDNPDSADTAPTWLSGPGAMNYWRVYFQRTCTNVEEHNDDASSTLLAHRTCVFWLDESKD